MKIAVIGLRGLPANYGGFETCAEFITREWVLKGNSVLVYCRKNNYKNKIKDHNGVSLRYIQSLPVKGIDTLFSTMLSVLDLIFFKRSYKIVHLYNSGNGIFIPLLRLFGNKVIVSVDGVEWKREKWGTFPKIVHRLGAYMCIKFSNNVVVDNKEVYQVYLSLFNKHTNIIEYGAKFIEKNQYGEEVLRKFKLKSENYFLFVGRFVPEKGVHNLIETFLKLETTKLLVLIGGDKTSTEYTRKIEAYAINNPNIIITGFLYNHAYEELLSNAYLYVSASKLEGTSPSLLAALGAKKCVLVNGIQENIQTLNGSGLIFKENDMDDFLKLWQKCNDFPDFVHTMSDIGHEFAKKRYNWEVIASKYLKLFKQEN